MSDRGFAISCSLALHLLVFGLMVFHWSSSPELRRAPKVPPHVMAKVMEETHRAAAQRVDKPEQKPQQPRPEPKKPEPKKPEPKPQPKPEPKPKVEKPKVEKPKVEKPKAQKPKVEKPKPEPEKPRPQPKPAPKPKVPDFKQPSMEQLMAEEQLEMARKNQTETDNEKPGTGEADSKVKEETASYVDAIRSAVERSWSIPATFRSRTDLSVRVRIQLIPGGEVASVIVVKSSGYANFDDSLVGAVKLASPLPVPKGGEFEQFRNFIIEFNPGDVQ